MRDSEFEDSVARMLQGRAAGLTGQGDPVGLTKQHLKSARIRRQTVGSATAVLVVAAGAALGGQAFGAGHGGGAGAATAQAGPAKATTPGAPSLPTASATPSGKVDPTEQPPPIINQHGQSCGTATKVIHRNVAEYTEGLRGSLAGNSDLVDSLKSRAVTLADAADGDAAKVVYAGEDATTRIVVVFVNPKSTISCDKGMVAVVFHGPAGTAAEDLKAQVGYAAFGPDFGFTWAERNADHSMSALVLNPAGIHTVQPGGDITGRVTTSGPAIHTSDGSYLTTYAAGATVPEFFDFQTATGAEGTSTLNLVVAASTKEAYAGAVGTTPEQVDQAPWQNSAADGTSTHEFGVGPHSYFQLIPTAGVAKGAEAVYWANYIGG